jgi:hypothetical protein
VPTVFSGMLLLLRPLWRSRRARPRLGRELAFTDWRRSARGQRPESGTAAHRADQFQNEADATEADQRVPRRAVASLVNRNGTIGRGVFPVDDS